MYPDFDLARLATVHLVPPTPFSPDGGAVRTDVLCDFIRTRVSAGIRVFIPAAGTGEFHSLTVAEIEECVRATRLAAPQPCVVMAPVGGAVPQAVQMARQGSEAGADALLLMPPTHPYLSDSGFRDYFQAIADAAPLPLLAYKKGPVPGDALLADLGARGRLIGIKYAVNDLDAFNVFADSQRGKLGLFCGTAERFAPFFMLAGAAGYTSGTGTICPRLTLALHAALASGRYKEAMGLLRGLRPIEDFRAREGDSFNISAVKFGLRACGHDFGPVRPPQRRLTPQEETAFRRLLEPVLAAEAELMR